MRTSILTRSFTRSRTILALWYMVFCFGLIALFNFGAFSAQESSIEPIRSINYGVEAPVLGATPRAVSSAAINTAINDARQQFGRILIVVDVVLIVASVAFSYILSGITLRPIRRALEDQEEFAQEVSHELRTPLSIMGLEIEALKRADAKLAAKHADTISNITGELKRMSGLVDGLLSLVHPHDASGRVKLAGTTFNITAAAKAAFFQLQSIAKAKRITYDFTSDFNGTIPGYEDDIKQVLSILLENAIKYTPSGGSVTLTIEGADKNQVMLTVKDSGKGILPQDLPHIFDRFYRGSAQHTQKTEGLGLGLAIARKRVAFHKGNIKVDSAPGGGTTARVYLPIK